MVEPRNDWTGSATRSYPRCPLESLWILHSQDRSLFTAHAGRHIIRRAEVPLQCTRPVEILEGHRHCFDLPRIQHFIPRPRVDQRRIDLRQYVKSALSQRLERPDLHIDTGAVTLPARRFRSVPAHRPTPHR